MSLHVLITTLRKFSSKAKNNSVTTMVDDRSSVENPEGWGGSYNDPCTKKIEISDTEAARKLLRLNPDAAYKQLGLV